MLAQQRIRGRRHNSVGHKQTEEHRRQLAKKTEEERSSRRNSNHQKAWGIAAEQAQCAHSNRRRPRGNQSEKNCSELVRDVRIQIPTMFKA